MHSKLLVNVLGVVYAHLKTEDGGDLYLTRHAEQHEKHLEVGNWYDEPWFYKHRVRLKGTGSVFKVPTKNINGSSIDLVVKNCRVGEDVPLDTHTLEEFCDAEFNSPWEEFSLVEEMRESQYGPEHLHIGTQLPLAIYVPPEKMQLWQSGRSRSKIHRIRAQHPGIDLDILKQYKLVYRWIKGLNLTEMFALIAVGNDERIHHLEAMDRSVMSDLEKKGYLVADTKPEHIIISEPDIKHIISIGKQKGENAPQEQVRYLYDLIATGKYSLVDYELLLRTPAHETEVKNKKRHLYLDDQANRYIPTSLPGHLKRMEIFGVPYIYGHAESTGGHLWVVGSNARLFDYFLPERWRKTPSIRLPGKRETFYTVTKDDIRLVWETSNVGEIPASKNDAYDPLIGNFGINSPFEEFAIAHELTGLGIPCAYVRAIYMTGSCRIEESNDLRRYASHKDILDPEGNAVLQQNRNYITIRGYYNGPDQWVARQTGPLYERVDLATAVMKGLIDESRCRELMEIVKENLKNVDYEGALLNAHDLLMSIDGEGNIVKDSCGDPIVVICNFQYIWKLTGVPFARHPLPLV